MVDCLHTLSALTPRHFLYSLITHGFDGTVAPGKRRRHLRAYMS